MSHLSPEDFFRNFAGSDFSEFTALPQSGSARKNFIGKSSGRKYVVTSNENISENRSFLYFSEKFTEFGLNTPKIFTVSEDEKMYIQEFLGEQTLSEIIEKENLSERVKNLVKQTLEKLRKLQLKTESQIDFSKTFEYEAYDEIPVSYDLFYFKFMFADILEVQYHKTGLLKEFKKIEKLVESLEPKGVMIRDFQPRNIMVNDRDEVFFIDYQSAMKGPMMYDVISFLFQAKADFPENFREEMLSYYYSLWENQETVNQLKYSLQPLQMMRFLQVLGVYGFRGLVQRKPHFIQSIEKGIENIYTLSESWEKMNEFPELKSVINRLHSEEIKKKIIKNIN
ncbi:MAG: phosphotransferase [Bergeyella sp.]